MRKILPTVLAIALTSPCVSDAQVKKSGGLFGFNRDQEQISSGLFPTEMTAQQASQTSTAPVSKAPEPPAQASSGSDGIFRGGSPSPVEPVSYTIEEGKKVEKSSKMSSLFGFGKKEKTEESDDIVTPVPPSSPYVSTTAEPTTAEPTTAKPTVAEPTVAKPAPAPVPQATPVPVVADERKEEVVAEMTAETPSFKTEEKESKSGGFFSFFSRKKSEPVADVPAVPAAETTSGAVATVAGSGENNIFEVPTMPSTVDAPEKEKKSIAETLLSPVTKIRPPKKELDFTGAETIIADGEIVSDSGNGLADRVVTTQGDGVKDPPKVVNGVKTYSSWDDVEGRNVSAAEKIISQIR